MSCSSTTSRQRVEKFDFSPSSKGSVNKESQQIKWLNQSCSFYNTEGGWAQSATHLVPRSPGPNLTDDLPVIARKP